MNSIEMKERTKAFAIKTGKLLQSLEYSFVNKAYTNQLIRCSSSVGANYRAAQRAKSAADFINKLKIVEEELDESIYFFELLIEFNSIKEIEIKSLIQDADELLRIIVASIKTSKINASK